MELLYTIETVNKIRAWVRSGMLIAGVMRETGWTKVRLQSVCRKHEIDIREAPPPPVIEPQE